MFFSKIVPIILAAISPALAIIHGTNLTGDSHEYVVAIMQPGLSERDSTTFICNGFLVTENTIVTAAECVSGASPGDFAVRVGFSGFQQTIDINNITTMPTYNSTTLADDISLLNLTVPVTNVTPAFLVDKATTATSYPSDSTVTLVGWGGTQNNTQGISHALEDVNVAVVRANSCTGMLATCGYRLNQNQRFCTVSNSTGAEGYGDAGGPVVSSNGLVVGLMTGNPSCAQPYNLATHLELGNPAVYDFIQTNQYGPL